MVLNFWDEKFSGEDYLYGRNPNDFFKSVIDTVSPGKILVPAAGEGRDAVYAAQSGWEVFAQDGSEKGKMKALRLAVEKNVTVQYEVCEIEKFHIDDIAYDAIVLTYFHLSPELRSAFHSSLYFKLRPGGIIILEAFNKKQLKNTSGGPRDPEMLMSRQMLMDDFKAFADLEIHETEIILNEGSLHRGKADVVRMIARK